MTSSHTHRPRWSLTPPKTVFQRAQEFLSQPAMWSRIGVCFAGAVVLYLISNAWAPAFPYRNRQIPTREMSARAKFQFVDVEATQEAKERARNKVLCLYEHDPLMLVELRQGLIDSIFAILQKPPEEIADTTWKDFYLTNTVPSTTGDEIEKPTLESLQSFKASLAADEKLEALKLAVEVAFLQFDKTGLLETLGHDLGRGNMREIRVYVKGNREDTIDIAVSQVRIPEIAETLKANILRELRAKSDLILSPDFVADRVYAWLRPRLPVSLKWNEEATRIEANAAAMAVEDKMRTYEIGQPLQKIVLYSDQKSVVGGGTPLAEADIQLLRAEHASLVQNTSWQTMIFRSLVFFSLCFTCFSLAVSYLWQRQPALLYEFRQFATLIGAFCVTYGAMWVCASHEEFRLEIIPLVLFAMAISIAYQVGVAIMLSTLVILLFTMAHSYDIGVFIVLSLASSVSALFCKTIRSRTKSVYIGLITAAAVFPVTIAIQFMINLEMRSVSVVDAFWFAGGAGFAGLIMTALLPFLEQWFDIQTDISLLELSDPNHPLLKQLVQRAPGTYNHSITVASIAESAADAIGANGLLCRVGAYFHDIGKMRKPEYFVENQSPGENKHDDLVPTMSTIVIISHVKDGAEMARHYHLPKRIVDLIEQHHGTTLVEYFFHRAHQLSVGEKSVEEANFRYPGPRPQSPEAAVLMLADAVEGACRTLREPAPSRIENLVDEITKKKLNDGQFDECSVTLKQIRIIQDSLVKSLNAMYHARVKYPDQQTA